MAAPEPTPPSARPRFTVVGAVFDVAAYLPDFIASIEAQDFDLRRVEVVMVDDGSTDDSRAVLDAWASRRPGLVRVVGQENAGQGAARNAGLAAAHGEWITFPDPDDIVDPGYLSTVDAFLHDHPGTVMVATHRVIWDEATGTTTNSHPLRRMFGYDRLVDLDAAESVFHGSAPAAFFDVDRLRQQDLRFDTRIRPNFEDGHFCASYLLRCERPLVGFLASTRYHYRKRADRSSSLQGSMRDPRRYTDVFEFGYLAILDDADRLRGQVPLWLQHFLCYELLAYLVAHDVGRVPVLTAAAELDAFHGYVRGITERLDLERVLPRLEFGSQPQHRVALAHGYADRPWRDDAVHVERFDGAQQLARVRYWFTGDAPDEEVDNGEQPAGPRHAKTRDLAWFGRVLVRERVLWVRSAPDLRVRVDGHWADLVFERPGSTRTRVTGREVRRLTGSPSRRDRQEVARVHPAPTDGPAGRAAKRAARPSAVKKYADAWVLMDRVHAAGDNAEVVFRRLRAHHPEVNAWFVVAEGSADWDRLRREFGRRVVAHGSPAWQVLMAHCVHLLGSHADPAIVRPPAVTEFTEPRWRFTFLQHGVVTEDLVSWIGGDHIDLLVTSTPDEQAWIAGDGSPYPFTTKEAQLTGLPRFDRLLEAGSQAGRHDVLLVAPTWRRWLVQRTESGVERPEPLPGALDSDFVRQWTALLASAELAEECRRHELTLTLVPHPNLESVVERLDLPAHVRVARYDENTPALIARAAAFVTDYSSTAFDAAYLDRPVVYLQFDADLALTGGHIGRRGRFDHARDGFGPVTATVHDAVAAIRTVLDSGAAPEHAERAAAAFPQRDGQCAERVIAAVLRSTQKDG
ncbi:glycosyltransferase involved in cell wall biosynthesis [Marmoricola sp. URHA0025 HA25]